jgi:thiol-disulfide isomerase/thioredoxin
VAALTGCTSLQGTGDKGFVSGDGRVVEVARDDREEPIDLEGEDLDGEPVDLAALRGKPVVVVTWGSWCAPCRIEADDVVSVAEEFDGRVEFVGINSRDADVAQAQAFERRFDVPFPSVYSPGGEALLEFPGTLGPNSIPAFVVLDREGRVASSIQGPLPSRTTLVELVEGAVAERADG